MKKSISILLCVCMLLALAAGCKPSQSQSGSAEPDDLKLSYTIDDVESYYFMDRGTALTAADTDTLASELETAGKWLTDYVLDSAKSGQSAIDFTVGDVKFTDVLSDWTLNTEKTADTETQTDYTLTYTRDGQPLTVTVTATQYKKFAIIEWTVLIENTGTVNSDVITDFYGLTQQFGTQATSDYGLLYFAGCKSAANSYEPFYKTLTQGQTEMLRGTNGKPSIDFAPYFNIQWEDPNATWGKAGVFFSVGWPGQWRSLIADTGSSISVSAFQQDLETYLKPGESIRSALMTLLFWEKDLMRSQNLWRRWVYNVAMPQPNGAPIPTMLTANTAQSTSMTQKATTQNQLNSIKLWQECGFEVDAWQMDAGWGTLLAGNWHGSSGNWTADPERFENGSLDKIGDALAEAGWEFILWYDIERISSGTEWHKQFKGTDFMIDLNQGNSLLNLANDDVLEFLIDFTISSMKEYGVTIYRQDNCMPDTSMMGMKLFWDSLDENNRIGITENKHVVNYLKYYDAILAEFPDTFIDNCAGGGRRLDLETVKRTACLWRDDKCYDAVIAQNHSWGINFWLPYSGQGTVEENPDLMSYAFRSEMMPSTLIPWKITSMAKSEPLNSRYKGYINEHKTYSPFLTADYYPLTAYDGTETVWMAWQFHDYQINEGIVQIFRRAECTDNAMTFYLSGLEPGTTYNLVNADGGSMEMTGRDLMVNGLNIQINDANTALIIHYAPVAG